MSCQCVRDGKYYIILIQVVQGQESRTVGSPVEKDSGGEEASSKEGDSSGAEDSSEDEDSSGHPPSGRAGNGKVPDLRLSCSNHWAS